MIGEPSCQPEETKEPTPPPSRPAIIRVFRALKRYENRRRRRRKKEAGQTEITMARWTRRVGLFTLALATVGIVTAIIFWRQLNVMQGQLDQMQLNSRAWITANVSLFRGIDAVILSNERTDNVMSPAEARAVLMSVKTPHESIGIDTVIVVKMTNVGKSPAIGTWANGEIYLTTPAVPTARSESCHGGYDGIFGYNIAPGETKQTRVGVFVPNNVIQRYKGSKFSNWPIASPLLVVCVTYRVPNQSIEHHTIMGFSLEQKTLPNPLMMPRISLVKLPIPSDELELIPTDQAILWQPD